MNFIIQANKPQKRMFVHCMDKGMRKQALLQIGR